LGILCDFLEEEEKKEGKRRRREGERREEEGGGERDRERKRKEGRERREEKGEERRGGKRRGESSKTETCENTNDCAGNSHKDTFTKCPHRFTTINAAVGTDPRASLDFQITKKQGLNFIYAQQSLVLSTFEFSDLGCGSL
jgi:hypothetical protein